MSEVSLETADLLGINFAEREGERKKEKDDFRRKGVTLD